MKPGIVKKTLKTNTVFSLEIIGVTILFLALDQVTFAQTDVKTFNSSKFGFSINYPSDWTFVPEQEDFTAENVLDVPLGDFCPTVAVGSDPKVLDCHMNLELDVPAYLGVTIFKLNPGTTVDEFYDQKQGQFGAGDKLTGRKNIETNKIEISGLPAIQRLDKIGGGSMDKLLKSMGQKTTIGKVIDVYVVNGDLGYRFFADTKDQDDFEIYSPLFQNMMNSVEFK